MGNREGQWRGSRRGQWDSSRPHRKVSDQRSRFGLVLSVPLHICYIWTQGAAEETAVTQHPLCIRAGLRGRLTDVLSRRAVCCASALPVEDVLWAAGRCGCSCVFTWGCHTPLAVRGSSWWAFGECSYSTSSTMSQSALLWPSLRRCGSWMRVTPLL